jgi:hypothetical protein
MLRQQQAPPTNIFANGTQPQAAQQANQGNPIDLRIILSRDEVAFLFGFDGMLINQLRQQTGAHIQLTDGESFEYILLVSGTIELIFKAFSLVCRKLWDLLTNIAGPGHNRPLKIRIAVAASQCGSIIGKAGAKVKEIRDLTGAQIQVSHDPLPNSTERCVEISGSGESCLQCTYHICCVMQDSPIRGEYIPYIPSKNNDQQQQMPANMDSWRPVFLCGDKAFIIDGQFARPAPPELLRRELSKTPLGVEVAESLANNTNTGALAPDHMNPLALMAAMSKSHRGGQQQLPQTSHEMTVNSEMINVMMAQSQGQKVEEIQRMSGAQVHISEQVQTNGDCLVTLSGSEESILLAQFLIQSNIDLIMKDRQTQQQQPPPPSQGGSLYPTNQFDPAIMHQNFDGDSGGNNRFQQQDRGGTGGGNFNSQSQGFRNNSGDRFQPRGGGGGGGGGVRGGRRSPPGGRRGGGGGGGRGARR